MEFLEALDEILQQSSLAAEEMSAAGDVEEEAIAAILELPWRGGGRIARRPQCQVAQGFRIAIRFERAGLQQAAGLGACIAQGLADEESTSFRGR